MGWKDSFRTIHNPDRDLSSKVFGNALLCAEVFKEKLANEYGARTPQYNQKYIECVYEFIFFFMHIAMRTAFTVLGPEGRNELQDRIVPMIAHSSTEALFGHWPLERQEGIKDDSYRNYANSEEEYSNCRTLILKR